MKLKAGHFNALIAKAGQAISWYRSHHCPCRDPNSGAVSADCEVCVNGRIWDEPTTSVLALSGQKLQRAWANFGLWEQGDVVCSLASDSPVYAIGEFDRVRFEQSSEPFSRTYTNSGPVQLNYTAVNIDRMFWLNPELTSVIGGTIPTVAADGTLIFGTIAPPEETQFTITGRRRPEYYCFADFPQDRAHFGGEPLPRKVVLRSYDLFRRSTG